MLIIKKLSFAVAIIAVLNSCDSTLEQDNIPYKPFDNIVINLTNIQYFDLTTKGYMEIEGGVKGIILYKSSTIEYFAYERNCSYLPFSTCAKVEIDASGLFMNDLCCGSQFSFANGFPTGGEATLPLRRYLTILNGNFLTVTDEPL